RELRHRRLPYSGTPHPQTPVALTIDGIHHWTKLRGLRPRSNMDPIDPEAAFFEVLPLLVRHWRGVRRSSYQDDRPRKSTARIESRSSSERRWMAQSTHRSRRSPMLRIWKAVAVSKGHSRSWLKRSRPWAAMPTEPVLPTRYPPLWLATSS